MKVTTPGNKRKSDGGNKGSAKKRKSGINGASDVSLELSPPKAIEAASPKKKIKMFSGTSTLNSPNDTPNKKNKFQNSNNKTPNKLVGSVNDKKSPKIAKQNNKSAIEVNTESVAAGTTQGSAPDKKHTSPNKKQEKKHKISNEIVEKFSKKKRHSFVDGLKSKINKVPKESLIAEIQSKMDEIMNRKELTKSAKRKLGNLKRFMLQAKGETQFEKSDKGASKQKQSQKKKQKANKKITPKPVETKAVTGKASNELAEDNSDISDKNDEDEESNSEEEATWIGQTASNVDMEAESDESDENDDNEGSEEKEDESADESDNEDQEDQDESDDESDDNDESVGEPKAQNVPKQKNVMPKQNTAKSNKPGSGENLANKQKQKYVLFIGNLPFDASEADISAHFEKAGKITSVRLPKSTENKSRGFAYVEVADEQTYQKVFSMHQTFIKGRQIKVEYTKAGNKNSVKAKKEIKAKNAKLHAMRKEGKLAGSKKEGQKRSFRRKKNAAKSNGDRQ